MRQIGRPALILAATAVLMQTLDFIAGMRLREVYGAASFELNPVIRAGFAYGGLGGAGMAKLSVAVAGAALLVELACMGWARVALTGLSLSAAMGLVGFVAKVV